MASETPSTPEVDPEDERRYSEGLEERADVGEKEHEGRFSEGLEEDDRR